MFLFTGAFKSIRYRAAGQIQLKICLFYPDGGKQYLQKYLRRQFIGDPISCIADGVPGGTLDLYCWIHSTFSVPGRSHPAIVYKYLCAYLQIFFVRLQIS